MKKGHVSVYHLLTQVNYFILQHFEIVIGKWFDLPEIKKHTRKDGFPLLCHVILHTCVEGCVCKYVLCVAHTTKTSWIPFHEWSSALYNSLHQSSSWRNIMINIKWAEFPPNFFHSFICFCKNVKKWKYIIFKMVLEILGRINEIIYSWTSNNLS